MCIYIYIYKYIYIYLYYIYIYIHTYTYRKWTDLQIVVMICALQDEQRDVTPQEIRCEMRQAAVEISRCEKGGFHHEKG